MKTKQYSTEERRRIMRVYVDNVRELYSGIPEVADMITTIVKRAAEEVRRAEGIASDTDDYIYILSVVQENLSELCEYNLRHDTKQLAKHDTKQLGEVVNADTAFVLAVPEEGAPFNDIVKIYARLTGQTQAQAREALKAKLNDTKELAKDEETKLFYRTGTKKQI